MPLANEDVRGANSDGSKSDDYCLHCYDDGMFTKDITMGEMIELNLTYLDEWNKDSGRNLTVDEAREELKQFYPTLKRWQ